MFSFTVPSSWSRKKERQREREKLGKKTIQVASDNFVNLSVRLPANLGLRLLNC